MIRCETIRPRLTAYLDGDLADADGSVVRGHLRECAACRQVAHDEAALRDGLRALPSVDPPPSMWAGVQAQLAAAEVADAHQPPWRRALARFAGWRRWMPTLPQLAVGSALAATAVVALTIRARRADDVPVPVAAIATPPAQVEPAVRAPASAPSTDVTADLAAEAGRVSATYAQAADELMKLAQEARPGWSDERRAAFDAKVVALRDAIARAEPGRDEQRATRALIRYLQGAVVRDDVLLASGGAR